MKKNLLNKQLIKAISLGISASMAFQPVTALAAEEANAGTSDNTGDHVLEVENTTAEETIIENSEAAISNAKEEIENAEKETGLTFDNSDDEVVAVTGEGESAVETVIDAKNDIEDAKEHSANRDKAIEEMNNNLDQNYSSNIDNAKNDFDEATAAAGKAEEISVSITEETVLADAENKAKEASAQHEDALNKLAKAEAEYDAAKAAYDKAFENYRKASEEGSKSFITINEAQRKLEEAREMLEQKREAVENQTAAATGYLDTVKGNDYQKIADSLEKLSKNETTSEEHAKLLIGAYIKANGGKDVAFGKVNMEYTVGLNENGEVKKETQTYNTVTYTNADGKEVVESYIVNVDENGEVSVSKVNVNEVDNTEVIIKEAVAYSPEVEGKEEVLESWSTADGTKSFLVSNDKIVKIETENGIIAIDTENLNDVSTGEDRAVVIPKGVAETVNNNGIVITRTTTYEEREGSEQTDYIADTHVVVDSYNTKTVKEDKRVDSAEELKKLLSDLQGQNAKVSASVLGISGWDYDVDPNNLKWYDKLNAWLWGSGFDLTISYEVEDLTSPKETHEEQAICEVVTKEYTEKTTTVTNGFEESGIYGWFNGGYNAAENAMKKKVAYLRNNGFTVDDKDCKLVGVLGFYHYEISYTSTKEETNTITKEVSRTRYAADTYTVHTEHQDAVEAKAEVQAQDAVYGTKLETTTAGSFVESGLQAKLKAQADAVALQEAAVTAAENAEAAYNDAVKAVEVAQKKVEELKKANTPVVTLAEAGANLNSALKKLSEATSKKNAADKAVANATTAVENANKIVSSLQAKEAARKAEEARRNQENNTNDGQIQSSDSASEYATVMPTVATTKKPAATTLETPEVLGAKKATTKKATKVTKTSTKRSSDKASEEKEDTKLAAEEKVETAEAVETTEAVVTPSEEVKTSDEQSVTQAETTIADEQTALADSVENKKANALPWIIVAILGVFGISVEEVVRRGSKKSKEKAKKN